MSIAFFLFIILTAGSSLFSRGLSGLFSLAESCFAGLAVVAAVFKRVCLLLAGSLSRTESGDRGTAEASGESLERLLQVMSRAESSLVIVSRFIQTTC